MAHQLYALCCNTLHVTEKWETLLTEPAIYAGQENSFIYGTPDDVLNNNLIKYIILYRAMPNKWHTHFTNGGYHVHNVNLKEIEYYISTQKFIEGCKEWRRNENDVDSNNMKKSEMEAKVNDCK